MNRQIMKDRLLSLKTVTETGCWVHMGRNKHTVAKYYQMRTDDGEQIQAHRLSAVLFLDFDDNKDKVVMHLCNNKECFNPEHLKVGTYVENIKAAHRDGLVKNTIKVYAGSTLEDRQAIKKLREEVFSLKCEIYKLKKDLKLYHSVLFHCPLDESKT